MILTKGRHWGRLRGKLSLNPEQALRTFGFVMRPDALGVIFRQYVWYDDNYRKHTGTFISNYLPASNPQTPEQQANRGKFGQAVIHWQSLDPARKQYYENQAKKKQLAMSGFNYHNGLWMKGKI